MTRLGTVRAFFIVVAVGAIGVVLTVGRSGPGERPKAPSRADVAPAAARPEAPQSSPLPAPDDGSILVRGTPEKRFHREGVSLSSPQGRLSISLADARIGGRPILRRTPATPLYRDEGRPRIEYSRDAITERYLLLDQAIEQIFVLDRSLEPLRSNGPLSISVALETSLRPVLTRADGPAVKERVDFHLPDGPPVFTYGGAVAIDAGGNRRDLTYSLAEGRLDMTLDADFLATAAFPLTVDPLISTAFVNIAFAGGPDGLEVEPDLVYSPPTNCYLSVFRQVESGNSNIMCRVVKPNLDMNQAKVGVDSTADESTNPRVARSSTGQFLVVWQEVPNGGGVSRIMGRLVTVASGNAAVSGTKFEISAAAATDDPKTDPRVGFCAATQRWLVVWKQESNADPLDHDILGTTVLTDGSRGPLLTIDADPLNSDENPTVQQYSNAAALGVAYVKRVTPGASGDIWQTNVNTANQAVAAPSSVLVASSADDEDFPDLGYSNFTDGTCYLTWAVQTGGPGNDYDIAGVQTTPAFSLFQTPFPIGSAPAHCSRPRNAMFATEVEGCLVVAYTTNPTFPPTAEMTNVETSVFTFVGDPPVFSESVVAGDSTFDDLLPCVAFNTSAVQALIGFQDQFNDTGTDLDIRARGVWILGDGPDLVVGSISLSPSAPVQGQSVSYLVRIDNVGTQTANGPFTVGLFRSLGSAPASSTIPDAELEVGVDIPAGGSFTATFVINAPTLAGPHTAWAFVDRRLTVGDIAEVLETNNAGPGTIGHAYTVGLAPDLAVTGMAVEPSPSVQGAPLSFFATVRNQGGGSSAACTLKLWRDHVGQPLPIATSDFSTSVPSLAPGESTTLSIPTTAGGPGSYTAWAIVDFGVAPGTVAELDENNNAVSLAWSVVPEMNAPSLVVTPPASSTTDGVLPLAGTADDDILLSSVTWVNRTNGQAGGALGTTDWTADVALTRGTNVITVIAWDAAGNATMSTVTVVYDPADVTAPSVAITAPTSATAAATPATVSGTASDDVGVFTIFWKNEATGASGSLTPGPTWSVEVPLTAGSNPIVVTVADEAGNEKSATKTLTFSPPADLVPPTLAVTTPADPTVGATGSPFGLEGTAADNVGISRVAWSNAATGGTGVALGADAWTAAVPLKLGTNLITVTAEDPAGNTTSAPVTVILIPPGDDTVPPLVLIQTPTSAPTMTTQESVVLLAGLAADDVRLGTVTWFNAATGESGTAEGPHVWSATVPIVAGTNDIAVTAIDTSGNSSVASIRIEQTSKPKVIGSSSSDSCGLLGWEAALLFAGLALLRRRV